jgi:hypothetical protein
MTRELTRKRKRFVEEYLIDLNATQAAIRAGYSKKTAYSIGQRNLKFENVQQALNERIAEMSKLSQDGTKILMQRLQQNLGVFRENIQGRNGVVYLLQADNGLVKIGKTVNFQRRFAMLNTQLPYALTVLWLIDCSDCCAIEASLHRRFLSKRVKGEWFLLSDEDIEQVKQEYGFIQKA